MHNSCYRAKWFYCVNAHGGFFLPLEITLKKAVELEKFYMGFTQQRRVEQEDLSIDSISL